MTTTTADQIVADYLARLDRAAGALPHDQARELVDEIGSHIASARTDGPATDEAAVRTMLDRLGTPEEIVAAAREDAAPGPVPTRAPGTGLELAAVLMLTAGSFLPVVGWFVGVVLLWSSRRWTAAEKLLGTLVVPFGPGGVLLLGSGVAMTQTCSTSAPAVPVPAAPALPAPPMDAPPPPVGPPPPPAETLAPPPDAQVVVEQCSGFAFPPWIGIPLLVVLLVAPFVVAVWLYRRASSRAAAEPPRPARPGSGSPWGALEIAAVLLLSLGTFLVPVVGALVGLVLAWCSPRWSATDKGVATSLTLLSFVLLALYYFQMGVSWFPFAFGALAAAALGPLAAALFLAVRLSRR